MIAANELRINNIIKQGEVDALHPCSIEILRSKARVFIEYCFAEPIPLTFEILEKCGFVNSSVKQWYHPETMLFELRNITALGDEGFKIIAGWNVEHRGIFRGISKEIKYLHQLQNLYFALTGDELPVNL
jgi:hypothetical protein